MSTDIDLGLSRYSDWAFTASVVVLVLALLLLAVELASLLLLGALGLAWSANLVIVLSAVVLMRYLGKRTLIALERLMGMLLVTLSVQMFLDGVGRYLNP